MPIIIKDETAGAVVMTIDNNGNLAFGDGTPINMLTLNGYCIIDSLGYIVHGLGSSAVIPASGSVRVPTNQKVRVYGIPGITPVVVCDTSYPAASYQLLVLPGSDPPQYYVNQTVVDAPVHAAEPFVGGFDLRSNTYAISPELITPGSEYYDSGLAEGSICNYRWI